MNDNINNLPQNSNADLTKDELIEKLQKISKLCDNVIEIKNEIDNFEPQDNYPRKFTVPAFPGDYANEAERYEWENLIEHEEENALEEISKQYDAHYKPQKPAEPVIKEFEAPNETNHKDKMKKFKYISFGAAVVGIIFALSILMNVDFSNFFETLSYLTVPLFIVAVAIITFIFCKKQMTSEKAEFEQNKKKALELYERNKKELLAEYNEKVKIYESETTSYKLKREDFLDNYIAWREIYLKSLAEEERIDEQLEADRQAEIDKIREEKLIPAVTELENANDLLSKNHLGAIDMIIDLLKGNRADTLKEAINVYEEIVYRERQIQLQKEQEAQRRYEEELRRQDEERRYQEEKQFREQQEWERKREAEEYARAEERRHREEMAQREKQERDRRYEENRLRQEQKRKEERTELERKRKEDAATQRQCNTCALCGNCSMAFRRPNCASYRPR